VELLETAETDGCSSFEGAVDRRLLRYTNVMLWTLGLSAAVTGYIGPLAGFAKLRQR
jgi:hypothetical protein